MNTCNIEKLTPRATMHIRSFVSVLGFSTLLGGLVSCTGQSSTPQSRPFSLLDERPFHFDCTDRPAPLPPGTHAFVTISPQAPYARTHPQTLTLPRQQVPALTIAAESLNWLKIAGADQDHWTAQFCAVGEGNTIDEANSYLQKVSLQQAGGLLTLDNTDPHGLTGGHGDLLLTAPADAPVTVHSSAAVEVHDMAGPVRISALGRATVLNTSGLVDIAAPMIDFAASQGQVSLNAPWDISIKLTAPEFHGTLAANAQRQLHALFPPGFQTPVEILVNSPKDFICHADFCSQLKQDRVNTLYRFTYGNVASTSDHIALRSENAQVTLDTEH